MAFLKLEKWVIGRNLPLKHRLGLSSRYVVTLNLVWDFFSVKRRKPNKRSVSRDVSGGKGRAVDRDDLLGISEALEVVLLVGIGGNCLQKGLLFHLQLFTHVFDELLLVLRVQKFLPFSWDLDVWLAWRLRLLLDLAASLKFTAFQREGARKNVVYLRLAVVAVAVAERLVAAGHQLVVLSRFQACFRVSRSVHLCLEGLVYLPVARTHKCGLDHLWVDLVWEIHYSWTFWGRFEVLGILWRNIFVRGPILLWHENRACVEDLLILQVVHLAVALGDLWKGQKGCIMPHVPQISLRAFENVFVFLQQKVFVEIACFVTRSSDALLVLCDRVAHEKVILVNLRRRLRTGRCAVLIRSVLHCASLYFSLSFSFFKLVCQLFYVT